MEKKKIYIVVKTYPTISEEYSELVCTAGVLEDGSWIRLYPIPFRKLCDEQKYPKHAWIEAIIERNTKDFRPESYRPNIDSIKILTKPIKDWDEKRNIIFKNKKIYTNLNELINKAKSDKTSLAVFKPAKITDFIVEKTEREWNPAKLKSLSLKSKQLNIFQTPEEIENEFRVVPKIPYKFSYKFEDEAGRQSKLMIEDWEIGMLYQNCLKRAENNENIAISKVRDKYFNEFLKKDLHLFLGTTLEHHAKNAPNPFVIIGVFYPPMPSAQLTIFDM